uniref:Uncharacterized protein n=1 Tax=Glossina brevipalpis TaxID=37001 RepID=A0A1A9WDW2_9MUSC
MDFRIVKIILKEHYLIFLIDPLEKPCLLRIRKAALAAAFLACLALLPKPLASIDLSRQLNSHLIITTSLSCIGLLNLASAPLFSISSRTGSIGKMRTRILPCDINKGISANSDTFAMHSVLLTANLAVLFNIIKSMEQLTVMVSLIVDCKGNVTETATAPFEFADLFHLESRILSILYEIFCRPTINCGLMTSFKSGHDIVKLFFAINCNNFSAKGRFQPLKISKIEKMVPLLCYFIE